MSISSFDAFATFLQDTLNHIYNPLFHPEELIFKVLGIKPVQGMEAVRQALRTQIEGMKPEIMLPSDTPSRRYYEILKHRYLDSLSQEETAFRLGMTPRNLRRIQQRAVFALAQRLWDAYQSLSEQAQGLLDRSAPIAGVDSLPILRELEVLQRSSPGAVADLSESLERIQVISQAAFTQRPFRLKIDQPEIQLIVPIHPSVLDQILLTTVEQLRKQIGVEDFRITASLHNDLVIIRITARDNYQEMTYLTDPAIFEMLNLVGGKQTIALEHQQIIVKFQFPAIVSIPILLIDDNPDFFHLFRRYTRLTRYMIHNIREGAQLQNALAEIQPQIIILDVLLPDVDGWQLLIDLQNPISGKVIPVIVCTALGQENLAYSLGARAYLPKPVSREKFLQTLDSIL